MSGSTTGIIFIVVIVVLGLALWLAMVARAARRPAQEHPQQDQMRGVVQGGQHVGGGRSVAPTRDAPVPEGGGDPPDAEEQAEEQKTAYGHRTPGEDRGNPLDLE
jgi:cytoskeletal protein RodZ